MNYDEFSPLWLTYSELPDEVLPGAQAAYNMIIANQSATALANVSLSSVLPVELAFVSYQAVSITCAYDGAARDGQVSCTVNGGVLSPGESLSVIMNVAQASAFPEPHTVTSTVSAIASTDGQNVNAHAQANIRVAWCLVRLNDTPMGSDIQAAINASTDATDVIRVSGYCRARDLTLGKTLNLQGGWSQDFALRNVGLYVTTLDGENFGTVIRVEGDASPMIEGFVFTRAAYNAVLITSSGNPFILANTFWGDGLSNHTGSPIIQSNSFIGSTPADHGGLYNSSGNPIIRSNTFAGNIAPCAEVGAASSGVINLAGGPIIEQNIFIGNSIPDCPGGGAGGIYSQAGDPIVRGNRISDNFGRGMFAASGNPRIEDNLFSGNTGETGSGLYIGSGHALVQKNTFSGNSANEGGGVYIEAGAPVIQNIIFSANHASRYGGGLYNLTGAPRIEYNTFTGNSTGNGTDSNGAGMLIMDGAPIIRGNIVANNSSTYIGGIFVVSRQTPLLDYNNVWNNTGGDYYGITPPGVHDISADPLFVDAANGDFHLSASSPCLDTADPQAYPDVDFDGEPRAMGIAPDIGADEYRQFYVDAEAADDAMPGGTLVYTLMLANLEASSLTNVLITDTLPGELAFESYQENTRYREQVTIWVNTLVG